MSSLLFMLAGFLCQVLVYHQALDVVRQAKVAEVLGSEYANQNNKDFRRRSNSRERVRRDSSDIYDRGYGEGDEVSIDKSWSGLSSFLVSISGAQLMRNHSNMTQANQNFSGLNQETFLNLELRAMGGFLDAKSHYIFSF
jgi:hypothetical protein